MKLQKNLISIFIGFIMVFSLTQSFDGSSLITRDEQNVSIEQSLDEFTPSSFAELSTRIRTRKFIESTRAIPINNATSLDNLFYRISALKLLDPSLGNLTTQTREYWTSQVLSFQNLDGGFGGWLRDRSSVLNTYQAISSLDQLNYDFNSAGFNKTYVLEFVESLRNILTSGYNSYKGDTDSDIVASSLAARTYAILGVTPPNSNLLIDHFNRAQNLDSSFVPTNELGGFGKQTNSVKNIYWTSEISVTLAAMEGLLSLTTVPLNLTELSDFARNLQTLGGGYVNDPSSITITVSYTSSAIKLLDLAVASPINVAEAENYLLSLALVDNGFKYQSISQSSSLKSTYFAIQGLSILGSSPSDTQATIDFLINWSESSDGYGGVPGQDATLRETFDAVAALKFMALVPDNPSGIASYIDTYRNLDGGYGLTGSFTDSTNRAVNTYDLLGLSFPNPQETITFLQSLQRSNGGFSKKASNSTTFVISSYRAILSLSLLGSQPVDSQGAIDYLKLTQNPDGGFGGYVGDSSDVSSTYRAVRSLNILGDSSFNTQGAIAFLQGSQTLDGGFKRSNYDVLRPNNISHAVFTYAALRGLNILNAKPVNVSSLYSFVVDLRNKDGGYGKHDGFTSDNAYTFTTLWVLRYFHEISGFSVSVASNLDLPRSQYDNFTLKLNGNTFQYNYTVSNLNTSSQLVNGISATSADISVDTTSLTDGTTQLQIDVFDMTGAIISFPLNFYKGEVLASTPQSSSTPVQTTPSDSITSSNPPTTDKGNEELPLKPILIGVGVIVLIFGLLLVRRRN